MTTLSFGLELSCYRNRLLNTTKSSIFKEKILMPLPLLVAAAIAKKKKAKRFKKAIVLKTIIHKKSAVKSKLIACTIANKKKNVSPLEKVMKIRAKAKLTKNIASTLAKSATSYKNGNKQKATGYFMEAAFTGISACASQKR
jgi:hypothetical protein